MKLFKDEFGIESEVYTAEVMNFGTAPYCNSRAVVVKLDDGKVTSFPIDESFEHKAGDKFIVAFPHTGYWVTAL